MSAERSASRRRALQAAASIALVAASMISAGCRDEDPGIVAEGTIEHTEVDVAPTMAARVVRVLVDEGASVRRGDTLAVLTQPTLDAEIEARRARAAAAEAQARDLEAGARSAEIAGLDATLRAAEAEATRTAQELTRSEALLGAGAISQSQHDAAVAAARGASGRRDAAREALRLARAGTRPERVRQARQEASAARATVAAGEATEADLVLLAPVDGLVSGRWAEPGEVIAAGTPALSVADGARRWVRVYLRTADVPKVRVGAPARLTLDAYPGRTFDGRVSSIASEAEFTPRVALTDDEREDLLFAVRVDVADPRGVLRAGLPVRVRLVPDSAAGAAGGRER